MRRQHDDELLPLSLSFLYFFLLLSSLFGRCVELDCDLSVCVCIFLFSYVSFVDVIVFCLSLLFCHFCIILFY